jgi:hypothetical protein
LTVKILEGVAETLSEAQYQYQVDVVLNEKTKSFTTDGTVTIVDICKNTEIPNITLNDASFVARIDQTAIFNIGTWIDTVDASHPTNPNSGNCGAISVSLAHDDDNETYLYPWEDYVSYLHSTKKLTLAPTASASYEGKFIFKFVVGLRGKTWPQEFQIEIKDPCFDSASVVSAAEVDLFENA